MIDKVHIPVMGTEITKLLSPGSGDLYLDLTAGYGGHAEKVMDFIGDQGKVTLVDRDINAINYLKTKFAVDSRVVFIHSDFENASKQLLAKDKKFDCILADLGVSSPHLDNPDRGFSFMKDGPLDMRMDNSASLTAAEVINSYSEYDLAKVLFEYGELRSSRRIAKIIVNNRPFSTTLELASVIPGQHKARMRLLAQVFQALRIEVNDELGQLERSLELWCKLLKPSGRLAVISFHSLEDRIIKQYFGELCSDGMLGNYVSLTKKPLTADRDEVVYNPRARSAKLRGLQRK